MIRAMTRFPDNVFTSEANKLKFALLGMDGEQRCNILGIKSIHYYNIELATKWYHNLSTILSQDPNYDMVSDLAITKLFKIYEVMISAAEDDTDINEYDEYLAYNEL